MRVESDGKRHIIAERGQLLLEEHLHQSDEAEILKYDLLADPDCLIAEADLQIFLKVLGGNFTQIKEKSFIIESSSLIVLSCSAILWIMCSFIFSSIIFTVFYLSR